MKKKNIKRVVGSWDESWLQMSMTTNDRPLFGEPAGTWRLKQIGTTLVLHGKRPKWILDLMFDQETKRVVDSPDGRRFIYFPFESSNLKKLAYAGRRYK